MVYIKKKKLHSVKPKKTARVRVATHTDPTLSPNWADQGVHENPPVDPHNSNIIKLKGIKYNQIGRGHCDSEVEASEQDMSSETDSEPFSLKEGSGIDIDDK